MRPLRYLVLFALVAFIVWPYYHLFRLDNALGRDDMRTLEQLLDMPAIRRNYKERLEDDLGPPTPPPRRRQLPGLAATESVASG